MAERKATVNRETKETSVKTELNIDSSSQLEITTGIRFLDHMLSQIAQHGIFDLKVSATGQDQHHVVEISVGTVLIIKLLHFNQSRAQAGG